MLRSVNIRALKDGLSGYLRDVRRGDILLVTDRGRVVAELRPPLSHAPAADATQGKLLQLAERGVLRLGLDNSAAAYADPVVRLPASTVREALAWTRGER